MQRITNAHLQSMCDTINRLTGSPMTYLNEYNQINVGHYHISGAYGGVNLAQVVNSNVGERDVVSCGHISKRDLYDRMYAYIRGIEDTKKVEA